MTVPQMQSVQKVTVDDHLEPRLQSRYHVYQNDLGLYSCTLNQVNLADNNNKFFLLQLLESNDHRAYLIFTRQGRVGYGGICLYDFHLNLGGAVEDFYQRFRERTGGEWINRKTLIAQQDYYQYIQMDFEDDDAPPPTQTPSSLIPLPVQKLMQFICNPTIYQDALDEFKVDTRKIPLGRLSSQQINRAFQVLNQLSEQLTTINQATTTLLSNQFYTLIPHHVGMGHLPELNSMDLINEKLELLKVLDDMKEAGKFLKDIQIPDYDRIAFQYHSLNCQIEAVTEGPILKQIRDYLEINRGHHNFNLKIREVYELTRHGEMDRFNNLGNVQLLWHGSRVVNFLSILSQGLKINPHNAVRTGSMFGNGIYFANSATKSAQYMGTTSGEPGLILLCEVALGAPMKLTTAQYVTRLPREYQSTHGQGTKTPAISRHTHLPNGTQIPTGQLVNSGVAGTSLAYDEYIVYDANQVRLKYLLWVDT